MKFQVAKIHFKAPIRNSYVKMISQLIKESTWDLSAEKMVNTS